MEEEMNRGRGIPNEEGVFAESLNGLDDIGAKR